MYFVLYMLLVSYAYFINQKEDVLLYTMQSKIIFAVFKRKNIEHIAISMKQK